MSPAIRSLGVRALAVTGGACGLAAILYAAPALQKGGDKTTYCIAVGADNTPLTDMKKDDFAIREDNVDRTIVSAKQATDPLDLVLIIDNSKASGSPESIPNLREGLVAFAKALYGGPAPVTMSVADTAGSSIMVAENKKSFDEVSKPLEKTFPDQTGNTVILEALQEAAQKLAKSPTTRRAIVVVNMDAISEGSSLKSQDVMLKIMGSGASLWVVTYQNQATKNLQQAGTGGGHGAAAASSGGIGTGNVGQSREYVLARAPALGGLRAEITTPLDLSKTLTEMANLIVNQYAVTYTRPDGPMPKLFQMASPRTDARIGFSQVPVK